MSATKKDTWKQFAKTELFQVKNIIEPIGFILDDNQLHISGERFLMTKDKLVLTGQETAGGQKVIIKSSSNPAGREEIMREKQARDALQAFAFAPDTITFPPEIHFGYHGPYLIWVTLFIPQEKVFVEHSLEEQFFLTIRAFEAQEAFHATTFEHLSQIKETFPVYQTNDYLNSFETFKQTIEESNSPAINQSLEVVKKFLHHNKLTLSRYNNYLTHTDFVPHNFRVYQGQIYMLDLSAIQFGNKYESWARFLNYMVIHNPELEQLVSEYLKVNRSTDEYLALLLMRMYKISFLLDYYTKALEKTAGNLHALTKKRLEFWNKVLEAITTDTPLDQNILENYKKNRDHLRSEEEKSRQREFAVA